MKRAASVLLALASAGCFNFKDDAENCRLRGRCQRPRVACSAGQFCWENPYPHGYDIEGLFSPGAGELWAVGEEGSILHLRDGGWDFTKVDDPTGVFDGARRVAADQAGGLLVHGGCRFGTSIFGCVFGRSDVGWERTTPLSDRAYAQAVAVTSAGFFVAGCGPLYLAQLESTDPWRWGPVIDGAGAPPLNDIVVTGPDRFWAGGKQRLVQVIGTTVEVAETPPIAPEMMVAVPGGSVMLIGGDSCTTRDPSGTWRPEERIDGGVVAGAPLNGRSYFVTTAYRTPSRWSELRSCEPGSCSACTAAKLTQDRLSSMASNGTEAWVGGANGRLFHVSADGRTTNLSPGSRAVLTDLFVADAGVAWATGEDGTLLRRGARGWEVVPTGRTDPLVGAIQLESGEVFVAGNSPTSAGAFIGVLENEKITPMSVQSLDGRVLAPLSALHGLVSVDAEHSWAFGEGGRVLRYLPQERAWRQAIEEAEPSTTIKRSWVSGWADPGGVLWLGDEGSGVVLRRLDGFSVEDQPLTGCSSVVVAGLGPEQPVGICGRISDPRHVVFRRRVDGSIEWLPAIPDAVPKVAGGVYALAIAASPPEDLWIMAPGTTAVARYRVPPGATTPRWEMVDVGLGATRVNSAGAIIVPTAFKLSQLRVADGAVWLVGNRGVVMRRTLGD